MTWWWRRKKPPAPALTPLAMEFARRLGRAVWLQGNAATCFFQVGVDAAGIRMDIARLLDHAAFSAYLDLRALGAVDGQSFRREDTGHGAEDAGSNPAAQPAQEGGRYERP